MTLTITARNPNDAFPATLDALKEKGVLLPSRNGPVLEHPEPVSTTFLAPRERCLFDPVRDANPFLHFFEPFWLLAGRRDVAFLAFIVRRFAEYSDDGVTFAAAYGDRLRRPVDQVENAVKRLRKDPADRRTVLQIRTPRDIFYGGKDAACNVSVALKIRDGALRLHVFNRSNDIVWGGPAGGTNHPQFTVLQEYLAGRIGCGVGPYVATTDSFHAYQNEQWARLTAPREEGTSINFYLGGEIKPFPLMQEPALFEADLRATFGTDEAWRQSSQIAYTSLYFQRVYQPMWQSLVAHKEGKPGEARTALEACAARDWALMADLWLARREAKTAKQEPRS